MDVHLQVAETTRQAKLHYNLKYIVGFIQDGALSASYGATSGRSPVWTASAFQLTMRMLKAQSDLDLQ